MKILIVDDHSIVRKGMVGILSKEFNNPKIYQACDGMQAVQMTKQNEFDVIMLDIMMPNMNGIEALKRMRKQGVNAPILEKRVRVQIYLALTLLGFCFAKV